MRIEKHLYVISLSELNLQLSKKQSESIGESFEEIIISYINDIFVCQCRKIRKMPIKAI